MIERRTSRCYLATVTESSPSRAVRRVISFVLALRSKTVQQYSDTAGFTLCEAQFGVFQESTQSHWPAVEFYSPLQRIISL